MAVRVGVVGRFDALCRKVKAAVFQTAAFDHSATSPG